MKKREIKYFSLFISVFRGSSFFAADISFNYFQKIASSKGFSTKSSAPALAAAIPISGEAETIITGICLSAR